MYKLTYIHIHGNTYQCQVQDKCKLSCQNLHQSFRMVLKSDSHSACILQFIWHYFTFFQAHNNFSRWDYSSSNLCNQTLPRYWVNLTAGHIMSWGWCESSRTREHSFQLCSSVLWLMEQINDAFKRWRKMGVKDRQYSRVQSPAYLSSIGQKLGRVGERGS